MRPVAERTIGCVYSFLSLRPGRQADEILATLFQYLQQKYLGRFQDGQPAAFRFSAFLEYWKRKGCFGIRSQSDIYYILENEPMPNTCVDLMNMKFCGTLRWRC